MDTFSQREFGLKPVQIVDQAPAWLRVSFYRRVYERMSIPHFTTKRLVEKLWSWLEAAYNSGVSFGSPTDRLEGLLLDVEWFHFYDAIEFIADNLHLYRNSEDSGLMPLNVLEPQFRGLVNELFEDCNIGWVLDSSGLLQRRLNQPLEDLLSDLRNSNTLTDAAQLHISKARKMLDRASSDFENSIKESIVALESVGRSVFPTTSTFGDVLKELRKKRECRGEMVSILQKAYDFSNSAPGIRHAGAEAASTTRSEAEYIYMLSLASIKYLREQGIT